MENITIGKFTLESLSTGMYSDPRSIFREYIQNATDSIDRAIANHIVLEKEASIHVYLDKVSRQIRIRDNGAGISAAHAVSRLSDVGNSEKEYTIDRGFRGIGRLGGLAYAKTLYFITSAKGEPIKTVMTWDCQRMRQLLSPSNKEIEDIIGIIKEISRTEFIPEEEESHYFEVKLEGVLPCGEMLLDESQIQQYLSEVAPVDYNEQRFKQGREINEHFIQHGYRIPCYNIYIGSRRLPVFKAYSQSLGASIGRSRKKENDFVRRIEFTYAETPEGLPLYIGWLAITDFSGQISDETVRGLRLRKSNILVGSSKTFERFFPSEGYTANKMFAGEIHILHAEIIPNSQRDDFEPNETLDIMTKELSSWAAMLNRKYRRGTSEASSAMRNLHEIDQRQDEIGSQIRHGSITSDAKRSEYADAIEKLQRSRKREEVRLKKAIDRGALDQERHDNAHEVLQKSKSSGQEAITLATQVAESAYATKNDLPSSYGREERRLYQKIIRVIDVFFTGDHDAAERLRQAIIDDLRSKNK